MLFFLGLLVIVGVAEAKVGDACVGDSICGANECCVTAGHLKGKRDVTGLCQLRGTETTNQQCYVQNRFHYNGVYTNKCPCAGGYTCVSSGVMEVPYGMMGMCQKHVKRETECKSGADCGPHECCRSRVRPLGKRQFGGGVCTPMGTAKSGCLVSSGSGKPDHMAFTCPCENGLTCKPNGQFDIPLGAMGYCQ